VCLKVIFGFFECDANLHFVLYGGVK